MQLLTSWSNQFHYSNSVLVPIWKRSKEARRNSPAILYIKSNGKCLASKKMRGNRNRLNVYLMLWCQGFGSCYSFHTSWVLTSSPPLMHDCGHTNSSLTLWRERSQSPQRFGKLGQDVEDCVERRRIQAWTALISWNIYGTCEYLKKNWPYVKESLQCFALSHELVLHAIRLLTCDYQQTSVTIVQGVERICERVRCPPCYDTNLNLTIAACRECGLLLTVLHGRWW